MATNFFERQDEARANTKWLVFYFVLAVISIIVSSYYIIRFSLYLGGYESTDSYLLLVLVALFTLVLVAAGSMYKMMQLSGGGASVAEQLGGKRIHYESGGLMEKRLINVVQEMALASGVSAPPVYLLDESGINAFAAGYSPDDAVIGVTRGAAERLSRSELQGVIAHEFSHILNGDMRLNIRLMGMVHGILILGLLGYYLLRFGFVGGHTRRRSRGGGAIALVVMGLGLMIVGYVGTFFGNLIKSAVNRQREYLADASAVQFTRHPDGLAGALMTIGGYSKSSSISHEKAEEASHMFFGQAISNFRTLFATHPPLEERIRRIKPEWDGEFPDVEKISEEQLRQELSDEDVSQAVGLTGEGVEADATAVAEQGADQTQAPASTQEADVGNVGQPSGEHLAYAKKLINDLPEPIRQALHTPYEARALVYALLIHPNEHDRKDQMNILDDQLDTNLKIRTQMLMNQLEDTSDRVRLPLLEMSLQELRTMSDRHTGEFLDVCEKLMHADDNVELFEWSLYTILKNALASPEEKKRREKSQYQNLKEVQQQLHTVLSHLATVGHDREDEIEHAFQRGVNELELSDIDGTDVQREELQFDQLEDAVEVLQLVEEGEKEKIIRAFVSCVKADNEVTVKEGELLRAVCELLECPMPPILANSS